MLLDPGDGPLPLAVFLVICGCTVPVSTLFAVATAAEAETGRKATTASRIIVASRRILSASVVRSRLPVGAPNVVMGETEIENLTRASVGTSGNGPGAPATAHLIVHHGYRNTEFVRIGVHCTCCAQPLLRTIAVATPSPPVRPWCR